MAYVNPRCNDIVAHLGAVQAELQKIADARAGVARGVLAAHRNTGAAHINVTKGALDRYINLNDPLDALAVEFGRRGTRGRGRSRGVYALTAALAV